MDYNCASRNWFKVWKLEDVHHKNLSALKLKRYMMHTEEAVLQKSIF